MTTLGVAVAEVQKAQRRSKKPLAVILAGHWTVPESPRIS